MSDPERLFSVEEANALLEDLRPRLTRIREARGVVISTSERVREMVSSDGGGVAGEPAYWRAMQVLRAELEYLRASGVVLRDPQSGLVDFPGELDGRRVWLCWRLDEDSVRHYHELGSGFAGRKPL